MAAIRGYIGCSLDGYIASSDGSLDWLTKYDGIDAGALDYERFIAGIKTVVMGRATYDAIVGFDVGWPYTDQETMVVTSRAIPDAVGSPAVWSDDIDDLVADLRSKDNGDVWVVGGGRLQQAFIDRGALDSLMLFVVPEIIGGGVPLFPASGFARTVRLDAAHVLDRGCLGLIYDFAGAS